MGEELGLAEMRSGAPEALPRIRLKWLHLRISKDEASCVFVVRIAVFRDKLSVFRVSGDVFADAGERLFLPLLVYPNP